MMVGGGGSGGGGGGMVWQVLVDLYLTTQTGLTV